jgi:hypothetical protein
MPHTLEDLRSTELETILQREARDAEVVEETHNSPRKITKIPNRNDKKKKLMTEKTITVQNRKANEEKTLFCFFATDDVSSESILTFSPCTGEFTHSK